MRCAFLTIAAALVLLGCSDRYSTVRTITPEEYGARSWLGHTEDDVLFAWGKNGGREPDGIGGHVLTYHKIWSGSSAPSAPEPGSSIPDVMGAPNPVVPSEAGATDLAKFWIGADGKIYRYWLADEVFRKHLDAPSARPVEYYGGRAQ